MGGYLYAAEGECGDPALGEHWPTLTNRRLQMLVKRLRLHCSLPVRQAGFRQTFNPRLNRGRDE